MSGVRPELIHPQGKNAAGPALAIARTYPRFIYIHGRQGRTRLVERIH